MDRWIDIDHPYQVIHLRLKDRMRRDLPAPLPTDQWAALEAAERRIYKGDPGSHGYTDVMPNDGDEHLNWLWEHSQMYVIEDYRVSEMRDRGAKHETIVRWIMHETARRVAQVWAITAFGAEILING